MTVSFCLVGVGDECLESLQGLFPTGESKFTESISSDIPDSESTDDAGVETS